MARASIFERGNIEEFGRREKKKSPDFRRVSIDEKYSDVRRIGRDESDLRRREYGKPPQARSLHVGSQMSQGMNPESASQKKESKLGNEPEGKNPDPLFELLKNKNKKTCFPENDLEHWMDDDGKMLSAVAEVLDRSRDAELIEARAMIEREFDDPVEQTAIDSIVNDYPKYFFDKKEQAERKKVKIDEDWIEAIRQFYIDEGKRWGLMKKIAPEKAELLGKYLELKLPVGIIDDNSDNNLEKSKRENEDLLVPEQRDYMSQAIIFLKRLSSGILEIIAKKEGREFSPSDLKDYLGSLLEDLTQKYLIYQPGYMDVLNENDLDKIVNMAVANRQNNK